MILNLRMRTTFWDFILFFLFYYVFNKTCYALHVKGVWYTQEEFFHFISKFGFQKTNQHEIELSEGYIFGNITLKTNTSELNNYATLTLVPHLYFVNFYKNRSMKSIYNADMACQTMFKEIEKEAYDAKCHDTGREDFLRKIPCPKYELCSDEDNAKNVMPGMQFTYAIQDINNPRFWFLGMVACQRNSTCSWEHLQKPLEIQYDIYIVNGKPFVPQSNPFAYHFSFEKQGTVELYLFCLLCYSCVLVPLQLYASYKQVHPITRLFTATLLFQLAGLVLDSSHLIAYSINGVGVESLNVLGDIFNIIAQSLFMMLLLLLAKGWAITRMILTRKLHLIILWASYSILIFVLYFWNKMEVDVLEDIDEYQTWPGWLTLFLRIIIMAWFLFELKTTMKYEHNSNKLQFFLQFGAASLVWFVYIPIVALIALQISPLWRYKVILGFTFCADLLAHSFMAYMLWPQRSEQYLLLANEVDLSEEMDAFDEAPHIVNQDLVDISQWPEMSTSSESLTVTI